LELAGIRQSSCQLKEGLPIFFKQLINVLRIKNEPIKESKIDKVGMARAAQDVDEQALAKASGHLDEVEVANSAGHHGAELLRLGYTLSHVVHAYGAMCQAITELAIRKDIAITAHEFHGLNRCLDVAIAGAVTEFQSIRNAQNFSREVEHLGFLAHELRNVLNTVNISLQLIESGTVGFVGSTGLVLKRALKRIDELIDRSLTEVRLRVDPRVHPEAVQLLQVVNQIVVTAEVEARSRNQTLEIQVDPTLEFEADQQLIYSAVSNIIQNALKYTRPGGKVQVRGNLAGEQVVIEVEDECGGLSGAAEELFKPFVQQHENRKGLGLGLTIAQRAIAVIHGRIDVQNLPGRGCIFKITLPKSFGQKDLESKSFA
jgi:hypothetical protein